MPRARNIFACLAHERRDCIIDLVQNLMCLDPSSLVLLYNGGHDPALLAPHPLLDRDEVVVHPEPQPQRWGQLQGFAFDCMKLALDRYAFDTLTIVDSDQLAIQPDYSLVLGSCLSGRPAAGLLRSANRRRKPAERHPPIISAVRELELWRPFLRRFSDGEGRFPKWSFWPATVVTARAADDLVKIVATDDQLQHILSRTKIRAAEEIVIPTLVDLLGYDLLENPCDNGYLRHRATYSIRQVENALKRPSAYWIHPIPRRFDDPLRGRIRSAFNDYERPLGTRT